MEETRIILEPIRQFIDNTGAWRFSRRLRFAGPQAS
jgi:hypothetical protein